MNSYTAIVKFNNGEIEEIDFKAKNKKHAKKVAQSELDKHYGGRGKITKIIERQGIYW